MKVEKPDLDYYKFIRWFGNFRDFVEIDIEKLQDDVNINGKCEDFPFTLEEITAWQKCGLIKISETYIKKEDFKPYQKITPMYITRRSLKHVIRS